MNKKVYTRNYILLKSFLANFRNYLILLLCFVLCISVIFTFVASYQMIAALQGITVFNHTIGIGLLIYDAYLLMIGLMILLMAFSMRHYERSRINDYEMLRTLGMTWSSRRKMKALEYIIGVISACIIGSAFGNLLVAFLRNSIIDRFPKTNLPHPNFLTYLLSFGASFLLILLGYAVTEDVFVETNFLNASEVCEKRPKKRRIKFGVCIGTLLIIWEVTRYITEGTEKISIILWLLGGILLVAYYGSSLLLDRMKKHEKKYYKNILFHQNFFHQYRTNILYFILFFGVWFIILFYYPAQILTNQSVEEQRKSYPYDYVWKRNRFDEKDNDFFQTLVKEYKAECVSIPMTTLTTPCMDQMAEKDIPKPFRQGQHIGIPVSAYEKLTGKTLSLEKDEIVVLLQQGKDRQGHPLDFYEKNTTYLHFGPAHYLVDFTNLEYTFTKRYHVKDLRRETLIGIYGNGLNENIVIFSNEVFEELGEKRSLEEVLRFQTKLESGEYDGISYGKEAEAGGFTNQLVLINVPDAAKEEISQLFEEQYGKPIEDNLYNKQVGRYYDSEVSLDNLISEQIFKNIINFTIYGIFIFIALFLSCVKVYAEQEDIIRESIFYRTFGLGKKEREKICLRRLVMSFLVPFGIALLFSFLFIAATVKTHFFTPEETWIFVKDYAWILCGAVIVQLGICEIAKLHLRRKIKKAEDCKSSKNCV